MIVTIEQKERGFAIRKKGGKLVAYPFKSIKEAREFIAKETGWQFKRI